MAHEVNITMSKVVSDQFVLDCMTTCIESRAMFWARFIYVNRNDNLDVIEFCVADAEDEQYGDGDDEPERFTMTPEKLVEGMQAIITRKVECNDYIREYVVNAVMNEDAGDFDEEAADVVIQAAFFDELVYG